MSMKLHAMFLIAVESLVLFSVSFLILVIQFSYCFVSLASSLSILLIFQNKSKPWKNYLFIYLFLAVLGLPCCTWAFSSCSEWGLLFFVVCRLFIAVASLARLSAHAQASVVVAHRLQSQLGSSGASAQLLQHSCSEACGIFPGQGLNSCGRWNLYHWTTREVLNHF